MTVSIVITTKDRKAELERCLESCVDLKGVDEILVYDDGSSDGTYELVSTKFPKVSLYRGETSLGLINARTKCASLAIGDILVSVDDDCIFDDTDTIEEIIPYFEPNLVAAVTIPCTDVLINPDKVTQAGRGDQDRLVLCSQFRGCAHALRKDVFLSLGGYYKGLVRQEEETDYSIRLYSRGYFVRMASCKRPILHYHSPVRNYDMISYYRMRNQLIIAYRLTPTLIVIPVMFVQFISTSLFEMKSGRLRMSIKGAVDAMRQIIKGDVDRSPVPLRRFFLYKKLRSQGPTDMTKQLGAVVGVG
ncbi:glycosyltransferase involved in cell wall biosynthesis [Haloferula luteola]|uniref:Glycosyltransferase involved in cell wall biosynthesis n=1 Tax=Haloferula luteola TaxID=595692 RepID=A0A840VA56_9BACT|nr:glycosyltransferase [Haloferula luteola]MBB5350830.1 glycosyltransferase involved in cell wall biosynthesis [Haloferula luteola]